MTGMKLFSLDSSDPRRLGPYRLLRRIATGGMGRIYLARQEAPGTPAGVAGPTGTVVDHGLVAVKTLLAEGIVSRPDRERFAREVELAGRVDSACTATVLDADPRAERPWLAIEFIPAPSLAELVVSAGTLPVDGVRWVAAGAARALKELHGLGVVHRDVKPLNVLLPHDGPRLIDFGISHAHDHTSSTTTIGTFAFASPEQACGRKSTAASDMYSLGAMLFFLAVGRPPYAQTDHSIGVLALVQRGELDVSGLPPELEPLVLPLLEVDPERRPAPSAVLQEALDHLDRTTGDRGDNRWLPRPWTELIEEYAEQGRQLHTGAVDFDAAEAPTRVEVGGTAEGADEAISGMREQLEALRRQRDALVRAQAEEREQAEAREFARRAEEERRRREAARKEAAERRERERRERERKEKEEKARRERERKEREQKEREREKKRKEQERLQQAKTQTSATGKSTSTTSTPKAAPKPGATSKPAKKTDSSEGWGGVLVAALVIGILIWQPWEKKDDDTSKGTPTSRVTTLSTSGGSSGSGSSGLGDGIGDSGTDSDTSSGSSYGDSDDTTPEPDPTTSSPTPDPTESAFKAVSYGDCLDVVDTGYGGLTKYDWSEDEPNTTSCGYGSRVKVVGTTGNCTSGTAKATWSYYSTSSGQRSALCLTGQYHQGDCLLAKRQGTDVSSVAMLSSPNCTDRRVPAAYNEILVVTDIYRAGGGGADVCRHGQYDSNTYWSTKVDDGATLLCMKAYD
ncbi:serine/threonine protein kinase [Streptomyces cucumeris]|uniref:serine/threonine protein kinase n=1 Tax=Streptomyces cucumeris TaxID=2962890 RepID=UPI003D7657A3